MIRRSIVSAVVLASVAASSAFAKNSLVDLGFSQSQINSIRTEFGAPASQPGLTFGSPGAFGANWGQIGIGIGGSTLSSQSTQPGFARDDAEDEDGSASLVLGVGDALEYVGFETVVTAISLKEGFAEDGSIDFKLHRSVPTHRMSVAIGVESAVVWGRPDDIGTDPSVYGVVSRRFDLPFVNNSSLPLGLNIGVGNERFVRDKDGNAINVFGGFALGIFQRTSWIVDWTGLILNSAISVAPFASIPLTVTAGAVNLGEQFDEDVEFAGGIGYTFIFN